MIGQNSHEALTASGTSVVFGKITLNITNSSTKVNGIRVDMHTLEKKHCY